MPGWVNHACDDYTRRLPRRWQTTVREFTQARGDNSQTILSREADALLAAIPEKAHVVMLDSSGSQWSTEELASQLNRWQQLGRNLIFLVGGAEGLHVRCGEQANEIWSLSRLTFPHPLARVILLEQLYRAQSLNDNHPYHRG